MKSVAGGLRLDLAAFRELEAFAQLGTELDPATQKQLDRGYRMVELLKQPQFSPMEVTDQVMSIFAGTRGYLDNVPVNKVLEWERDFIEYMGGEGKSVRDALASEGKLTDDIESKLIDSINAFNKKSGYDKKEEATA